MLSRISVLALPGTMFAPSLSSGGAGTAERQLRLAFANIDVEGIAEFFRRLRAL